MMEVLACNGSEVLLPRAAAIMGRRSAPLVFPGLNIALALVVTPPTSLSFQPHTNKNKQIENPLS